MAAHEEDDQQLRYRFLPHGLIERSARLPQTSAAPKNCNHQSTGVHTIFPKAGGAFISYQRWLLRRCIRQ